MLLPPADGRAWPGTSGCCQVQALGIRAWAEGTNSFCCRLSSSAMGRGAGSGTLPAVAGHAGPSLLCAHQASWDYRQEWPPSPSHSLLSPDMSSLKPWLRWLVGVTSNAGVLSFPVVSSDSDSDSDLSSSSLEDRLPPSSLPAPSARTPGAPPAHREHSPGESLPQERQEL